MGRSKRHNNEAKEEDRQRNLKDEPERKVVKAKTLKRPSSKRRKHLNYR
jgi:hypothetical protein